MLKEYEDKIFMELRERMLDDKGLPDLEKECKTIISNAKQQSSKFRDFETAIKPEMMGLQDDRLMKHKHMALLSQNMMKLNSSQPSLGGVAVVPFEISGQSPVRLKLIP